MKIIIVDGKEYLQFKDKLLPITEVKNGIPIIKAESKEIKYPDGKQDVIISIPCLQLNLKKEE